MSGILGYGGSPYGYSDFGGYGTSAEYAFEYMEEMRRAEEAARQLEQMKADMEEQQRKAEAEQENAATQVFSPTSGQNVSAAGSMWLG